jgi:hypothetical protein
MAAGISGAVRRPLLMLGEARQTLTATSPRDLPYNVSKAGPVGIAARLAPIGESQVVEGVEKGGVNPLVAAAMAAAGLNPRYTTLSAPQRAARPRR